MIYVYTYTNIHIHEDVSTVEPLFGIQVGKNAKNVKQLPLEIVVDLFFL